MEKLNNSEPSLHKIDDYNGKESKEKKNIVRLVIVLCLVVGAFVVYFKSTSVPADYVGTPEKPGINTTKN
jgi:hypothetical protein